MKKYTLKVRHMVDGKRYAHGAILDDLTKLAVALPVVLEKLGVPGISVEIEEAV